MNHSLQAPLPKGQTGYRHSGQWRRSPPLSHGGNRLPRQLLHQSAILRGDDRISQVPGQPQCIHALLSDPGGTLTQMPKCVQVFPSASKHAVGSPDASLSGLNHTAYMLPVHASQKGLPQYCATPDSGCRHAWPEGIHYPLGCYEKFQRYVTSPPNFPGLTWRTLGPIPVTRSR